MNQLAMFKAWLLSLWPFKKKEEYETVYYVHDLTIEKPKKPKKRKNKRKK
jgi:hypothetical protein